MIEAVLFDFDGTLIDTNDLIFKSYEVAFQAVFNRKIEMDEILSLYGKPLYPSLMKYGEEGERLYQIYREFNATHHDELAKPFLGVLEGVNKLSQKGYKLGIVTSKRPPLVKRGLEILGLSDMFDVIVTPEDTKETKPHPEPILFGCKKLEVLPQNAIYVGDSVFDLEAGQAAGTKLCAVKYSVTPKEALLKFNPDYFVESIEELAFNLGERLCH
ncbi:MAG: pyrophosphatase PpaX [Clostridia bacterium]|nr:pyrophosphatase PpaX [Clostridia bacterium]